jgi:hypothetical protein
MAKSGTRALAFGLLLLAGAAFATAQEQQSAPECDKSAAPGQPAAVKALVSETTVDVSATQGACVLEGGRARLRGGGNQRHCLRGAGLVLTGARVQTVASSRGAWARNAAPRPSRRPGLDLRPRMRHLRCP